MPVASSAAAGTPPTYEFAVNGVINVLHQALAEIKDLKTCDSSQMDALRAEVASEKAISRSLATQLDSRAASEGKALEELRRFRESTEAADKLKASLADTSQLEQARATLKDQTAHIAKLEAQLRAPTVDDVSRICDSIMVKLEKAYSDAFLAAKIKATGVGIPRWSVSLDDGSTQLLPDNVQLLIDDAIEHLNSAAVDDSYVGSTKMLDGAYRHRAPCGTKWFDYDIEIVLAVRPPSTQSFPVEVHQINTQTCKRREVKLINSSATGAGPTDAGVVMNEMKVPLSDASGCYIFKEEFDKLMDIPFFGKLKHNAVSPASDGLLALANTFSAPFCGHKFTSGGKSQSWSRSHDLLNFVRYGKHLFEDPTLSGAGYCFVWAHGTNRPESIADDYFGMNMRYTDASCVKGKGIYVAANDFVPTHWSKMRGSRVANQCYVLGVALSGHDDAFFVNRYALQASVTVEPAWWKKGAGNPVKDAICMPNAQQLCAFPLGCLYAH
jgi:hypothetical protein